MSDFLKMALGLMDESDPISQLVGKLPSSNDMISKFMGGEKKDEYDSYDESDYYDRRRFFGRTHFSTTNLGIW